MRFPLHSVVSLNFSHSYRRPLCSNANHLVARRWKGMSALLRGLTLPISSRTMSYSAVRWPPGRLPAERQVVYHTPPPGGKWEFSFPSGCLSPIPSTARCLPIPVHSASAVHARRLRASPAEGTAFPCRGNRVFPFLLNTGSHGTVTGNWMEISPSGMPRSGRSSR